MFKPTDKFRVIINGVSVYTKKKDMQRGIGDFGRINDSVYNAFRELERLNEADSAVCGCGGTFLGMQVQIDKAVY